MTVPSRPIVVQRPRSLPAAVLRLVVVLVALLAVAAPLRAADAPRLSGGITDISGVITNRAPILAAQQKLFDATGTQLYVVYLPTTDGENIDDVADAVIASNQGQLTAADALLLIATEDRDYTLVLGDGLSSKVSATELDQVTNDFVLPALRNSDWGAAAVGAATGLQGAISGTPTPDTGNGGSSGGGLPVLPIILLVLVVIGVIAFVVLKGRGAQQVAGEAQTQEELGRRASSLLVSTDEALRKADQEIGFAEAQFGTDEAKALGGALAGAKEELSAAFRISTALDDETPETPAQRRAMLEEIIARCERANAAVAEQQAKIDGLRDLGRNAEQVLPTISKNVDDTEARIETGRQTLASFAAYAPSSWAAVASNADTAATRIATARASLDAATAAVAANRRDDAAVAARKAETAVAEAAALLTAIADTDASLKEMSARLIASLVAVHADVLKADMAVASGRATAKTEQLAGAKSALAQAQAMADAKPPDVAGATRLVTEADGLIDQVLEDQQRAAQAAMQAISLATTSIAQAQAQVNGGLGGRRALSRLSEAQGYLARANELLATDPVAATQAAQTADALADEALAEARADAPTVQTGFGGGTMPPISGQGTRGGGGLGDILTGIVLGGILNGGNSRGGSSWGGGGVGWGGGTGSGGFGGGTRRSSSGGSRSGGGMRAGRRSGGSF